MRGDRGRLFVISAPSGAGKSTITRRIITLRPEIVLSVSFTTRQPRDGEKDGVAYHFVSKARFGEMIGQGEFLEYAEYVGEFYGTPKRPVCEWLDSGKDVLLEIEVRGARQVMAQAPDATTIFIVPPDMQELERRLRGRRSEPEEKMASRLDKARQELREKELYKHIVVNDNVSRAAEEILGIIDCIH